MSVFRPDLFKNCVAIVTGGGTGIGRAISYELLTLGANVVIASRSLEKLENTANDLRKMGDVTPIQCNIRKEDEVKGLIQNTITKYGKLDFLVNNGGGQFQDLTANFTLKGWNAVIDTNLTGTYLMMREAFNQWFSKNGGSIVNIIADVSRGFPLMSHSGAARAAVHNLTMSTAIEWASHGVRVNSLAPGIIESPTAVANYSGNVYEAIRPHLPAKRTGVPDEIAGAVCFLLSPAASFISGVCLKVDCASSLYTKLLVTIDEHDKLPAYKWIPDPPVKSKGGGGKTEGK